MARLIVTIHEAKEFVARTHSVRSEDVTIEDGNDIPHSRTEALLVELIQNVRMGAKLQAIKCVRELTGIGLKEAKDLVDKAL